MSSFAKPEAGWWQDLIGWDLGYAYLHNQRWLTDTINECDYRGLDDSVWTVLAEYAECADFVGCGFEGDSPSGSPRVCAMPADHESPHVWQQRDTTLRKLVVLRLSQRAAGAVGEKVSLDA